VIKKIKHANEWSKNKKRQTSHHKIKKTNEWSKNKKRQTCDQKIKKDKRAIKK
jgi:hypothetical protein